MSGALMHSRDILGEILNEVKADNSPPVFGFAVRLAPKPSTVREPKRAEGPAKAKPRPGSPGKRQRTTCYLDENIQVRLEQAKTEFSGRPRGSRSRISKSLIINQALEIVLGEYAAKGEQSRLSAKLSCKAGEESNPRDERSA